MEFHSSFRFKNNKLRFSIYSSNYFPSDERKKKDNILRERERVSEKGGIGDSKFALTTV